MKRLHQIIFGVLVALALVGCDTIAPGAAPTAPVQTLPTAPPSLGGSPDGTAYPPPVVYPTDNPYPSPQS